MYFCEIFKVIQLALSHVILMMDLESLPFVNKLRCQEVEKHS